MWSIKGESCLLVGVVGGKLQGVEAAYLAHKAGWEVRVVDRMPRVPASGLGDSFVQVDVTAEDNLDGALGDAGFVIPALEDDNALRSLARWSRKTGVPLAFDPQAYGISSSKLKSTEIFRDIGLPIPAAWPQCSFPVLAKPGRGSGSKGVAIFQDLDSLKNRFSPEFPPRDWVLEEFLDGSQHSLEVVGRPGNYRLFQVTDLYVDQNFDCKRVIAPSHLPLNLVTDFEKLSLTIAQALNLNGIMDVEVIFSRGEFKVLEIDARLPSQTPTAVYWSTNQNMVRLLGDLYTTPQNDYPPAGDISRGTVYEHIHVSGDKLMISGERIMTEGGPLNLQGDFFGADEAITNFEPGKDRWVATLIFSGTNRQQACEKRNRSIAEIVRRLEIKEVIDPQPEVASENVKTTKLK
jgi:pyrrolysine biosynthesis protein PylC